MNANNTIGIKDETIVIISLVTAVCLLGNSMLYITLPLYWQEIGLTSLWEVGLLLSINRMVRLPLNAFIGWLYSKITIRLALSIAVFFAAVATLGYGVFSGLVSWLILRVFWGIAWSLLKLGGFFAVLMEAEEDTRGVLMGKYNGLHRLGDFFGMLVGGFLTGILGFRTTLLLFGFIIILALPIIFYFIPNYRVGHKKDIKMMDHQIKLPFQIVRVVIGGLVIAMLFEGVVASTLSLLVESYVNQGVLILGISVTAALSGLLQGIRWLWEPFIAPFIGRCSDEKGSRINLYIPFLVMGAIGFFLAGLKLPLFLWILVILMLMLIATALVTLSDSLASDLANQSSSIKIMTIYTIALDIGAAIGPFVSYQLIMKQSGLFYTYVLGATLLLVVSLLWIIPQEYNKFNKRYCCLVSRKGK